MKKGLAIILILIAAIVIAFTIFSFSNAPLFGPTSTKSYLAVPDNSISEKTNSPSGFGDGPSGSPADGPLNSTRCIPVRTPQDMDNVRNNLAGKYCQMNDIDLSNYESWNPIGNGSTNFSNNYFNPFAGVYDGRGFKIYNLKIILSNESNLKEDIGLFGVSSGVIQNTHLVNVYIEAPSGNYGDPSVMGSLVGANTGTVQSSSAKNGTIIGNLFLGGLVGINNFQTSSPIIKNSSADISVTGEGFVGGLVGENTGYIEESFALGGIEARWGPAGGFVGAENAWNGVYRGIMDSYSMGKVTAQVSSNRGFGGFAGEVGYGKIKKSYSIGYVSHLAGSSVPNLGGFLGSNLNFPGSSISQSYWDIQTSGQSLGVWGFGRTTKQMQTQSNYAGWDFNNTWRIQDRDYPRLRWKS